MGEFDDLITEIKGAARELVSLEIRTIVGAWQLDNTGKYVSKDNGKMFFSKINLLQGDITYLLPDDVLGDTNLEKVLEIHKEREKQGCEIIQKNIETLKKFMDFINSINK